MGEPLDLDAIRAEIEGHLGELPQDLTCCPGCRVALEDVPALVAEVERLRALLGEDDGRHRIEFRADGWTIMHPLACRPNLFACEVNRAAGRDLTGPPAELGRYVCSLEAGQFVIGERIDG